MKEIDNWERNKVLEEVKNIGQKRVNKRLVITEKVNEGKTICKAQLVARGFEEELKEIDTPTCVPETLKL